MARPLPPRAARTFYNAADAWLPPGPGPGGGDVDLAPGVAARLAAVAPSRRRCLLLWLAVLERQPRLAGGRGFSWLPRERRARVLRGWEGSRLAWRRRPARTLHRWARELHAEAVGAPGPAAGGGEGEGAQSRPGA